VFRFVITESEGFRVEKGDIIDAIVFPVSSSPLLTHRIKRSTVTEVVVLMLHGSEFKSEFKR
jgi:hypothetical protein